MHLLPGPLPQILDVHWTPIGHLTFELLIHSLHTPLLSFYHQSNGNSIIVATQARPSESPQLIPCSSSTHSVHGQIHWLYLQNICQFNLSSTSTPSSGPSQPSLFVETWGKASAVAFLLLPLPLHPMFPSVLSPNSKVLKYITSHSSGAGFSSPSNHILTTLKCFRSHMMPTLSPLITPNDIPPSTL